MCPFCTYSCVSEARMEAHLNTQHMANNPSATSVLLASQSARFKPDNLAAEGNERESSTSSKSSVTEHLLCPLCQEKCTGRSSLEQHLVVSHSVKKEGLDKLLLLVDPPAWTVDTTETSSESPAPSLGGSPTATPEAKNGGEVEEETDAIRIGEDGEFTLLYCNNLWMDAIYRRPMR